MDLTKNKINNFSEVEDLLGLLDADRVNAYYKSKALNNSTLGIVNNPTFAKWKQENPEIEDAEKRHFRIGSAVDCFITDRERFNTEFYLFDSPRPSGLMGKFVDALPTLNLAFETIESKKDEKLILENETVEYIWFKEAYEKAGYKISIKAVVENFFKEAVFYYKARCNAMGKTILSKDEWEEFSNCVEALQRNPRTPEYFFETTINMDRYIRLFQLPLYFDYEGVLCKALLDLVIIDKVSKTWRPVDLKTTGKLTTEFPDSFRQWSYDRQSAFYYMACKYSGLADFLEKLGYKYQNFQFIVAPKKRDGSVALIYTVKQKTIAESIVGTTEKRGIMDLFQDYKYHIHTGDYTAPKFIIDKNFEFEL